MFELVSWRGVVGVPVGSSSCPGDVLAGASRGTHVVSFIGVRTICKSMYAYLHLIASAVVSQYIPV